MKKHRVISGWPVQLALAWFGTIVFFIVVVDARDRFDDRNQIRVREEGKTIIYKKRNIVDFDETLIEGEVKNPSEFYFVHRPEEKFGSLVKPRKNFHKEMLRDTIMIR